MASLLGNRGGSRGEVPSIALESLAIRSFELQHAQGWRLQSCLPIPRRLGGDRQSRLAVEAGQVGDDVDGAGMVVEPDDVSRADGDQDQVGDGLSWTEVEVGGGGPGRAAGVDGQEAARGGAGDGDVEGDGSDAGRQVGDGQGERGPGAELRGGSAGPIPGVQYAGRCISGEQGAGAGVVGANEVGDDVDGAGMVVEPDDVSRADGDQDQVGDGLSWTEVEVGGGGPGRAAGVDGQEAARGGAGDGDVEGDGSDAGRQVGDGQGERGPGAELRGGSAGPIPGVQYAGRCISGEQGAGAGVVVANEVGDDVDGAGMVVAPDDVSRADGDQDQVGDGLSWTEVEVGGGGAGRAT